MSFRPPSWESLDHQKHRLVLWINNIYPIKVHKFDFRSLLFTIPITMKLTSMFPQECRVVSIEKRIKEGGAYVHLEIPDNAHPSAVFEEIREIFRVSKKYFKFASRPAKVERVHGEPLVEDMQSRFPSNLIKVTPKEKGMTLDTDEVYRQFRCYGRLYDITKKDPETNQIMIHYDRLEGAIAARNCLHKAPLPSSKAVVVIEYVAVYRMGWVKEHLSSNPRIFLPLVGLFATLFSFVLFDPIRSLFIEKKLAKAFREPTDPSNLMPFGSLCHRKEEAELRRHLFGPPASITVLSAPRGSGKSELVCSLLRGRKRVIRINFAEMDSIPDADFINRYYPTLTWMAQISGWIDILPLGLSKGTFSWSAHSQLENIFYCLENSLCSVAHDFQDEAAPEWPVIVLDGFLENLQSMENRKEAGLILDVFSEFAITFDAQQVKCQKRGLAHIFILSSDPSAVQTTYKVIASNGGSKVKAFTLTDIPEHAALEYMHTALIPLTTPPHEEDIEYAIKTLGGRVADLETFSQKVIAGQPPRMVINRMVHRAMNYIRTDGFGYSPGRNGQHVELGGCEHPKSDKHAKWTQVQLWKIIRKLTEEDVVYYDDIVSNIFGGNVEAFTGLLNANLLRVTGNRVTAYSPLYRSAFKHMVEDKTVSVPMDMQVIKESLSDSNGKLNKLLDELVKLKSVQPFLGSLRKSIPLFQSATIIRELTLEKQLTSVTQKISIHSLLPPSSLPPSLLLPSSFPPPSLLPPSSLLSTSYSLRLACLASLSTKLTELASSHPQK